jgi:methionyl-tRNA formyltransferase
VQRLVVFADPRSFVANVLVRATIDACRARSDIDLVAVCETGRRPALGRSHATRLIAKAVVKRLFDPAQPIVLHAPMWRTFRRDTERAGIPKITPDERNINHPEFVTHLRRDLRPDLAFSFFCEQIFRDELLSTFRTVVNYHNGLLPAYRGLRATGWSLYRGEPQTGFTFHRMTLGIDEGPVLHADAVTVRPEASPLALEWDKTVLAARAIDRVVDAMIRDDPGSPQTGPTAYYSGGDCDRITTIDDPSSVTWDDLRQRLRSFSSVDMRVEDDRYRVTRVDPSNTSRDRLTFRTADGKNGRPTRLHYLPPPLYRLYRRFES